ncbi:outer membrane beta-barrel protein [Paludisphaera mucosa]|uniref:Outer membrane beta-barrel protein n=1 Tax=Paludisphaera mucosa TaxID=3030827 RepID=A0ABT6F5N7_9BACT|nr:outer membrane beta-barrel protein [Paludisphaera mucosa]MDG3002837.1 outer membrane beta-barrel protein [Paludisphaera mucosa]
MKRISFLLAVGLTTAVTTATRAQEPSLAEMAGQPPADAVEAPPAPALGPPRNSAGGGLEAESLPAEQAEDLAPGMDSIRTLGPTPVADVRFLMDQLGLQRTLGDSGIRSFGWIEGGYTGASPGSGLLSVEPRQNRFGNEFLLNQIGLVLQKPLQRGGLNFGFNVRYFAGADAALGQPKGGIGSTVTSSRFSQDFRDLYVSAHLPILTELGMDVKVGRMNSIIGYNGFLAPYRPFYSSDYQFFYSQDGAFTGALTNLHVSNRLDVWNGVTLGANTFFTMRSAHSVCYIGQVNYWLTDEQKTRLTGSVYAGPNAIFAAPGMAGDFNTTVELRVQQNWTQRFTQIVQSNMGWDSDTPVGTGSWYGVYTIGIYHLSDKVDALARGEWFTDVKGTRTGISTDYSEVTLGLNWHPVKYLDVRPEIRGDFAGAPAFGVNGAHTDFSQLTGGISCLVKF